jgi:hypothetical protein
VVLVPVLGLLAVGNVVFALLWLLSPISAGPAGERGRRRIEARMKDRALRVVEGVTEGSPATAQEGHLASESFEELSKEIARLAKPMRAEAAQAYFESEAGRKAEPAVTLTFPSRKGTDSIRLCVLDARRQAIYGRLASTDEPLVIKTEDYEKVAGKFAQVLGSGAGSLALPYYVPVTDAVKAKLAKLQGPLSVTTVSADPRQYLVQALSNPLLSAGAVEFAQPDAGTVTATMRVPDDLAMARGLADAMARASDKVTARYLDFTTQPTTVKEFARAAKRSLTDISDSLVLQYGDRVRVIHSSDLVSREETPAGVAATGRFEGEKVVTKALDDLVAERGLVYFAEGFGERRITESGREGFAQAAGQVSAVGFRVASLDLTGAKEVPANCAILVIAGTEKRYSPGASDVVTRYVEGGGRLALLLDPPKGAVPLAELLKRYGLSVPNVEKLLAPNRPELGPEVVQVDISRKVDFARRWPREMILFLTAGEVEIATPPPNAPYEVIRLASASGAEGEGEGACVIAAVRPKGAAKGPKLIVCTDVDAFSNQVLRQLPSNGQLLANVLTWLAE